MLDDCQLFTLLITPHLLENIIDEDGNERQNYVLSTELPLARKNKREKGTGIFAVEIEETDKNALYELDIIDFVKCDDVEFKNLLSDSISRIAKKRSDTPEHNFLIGLAYLDGIDVEVDRARGLKLIESAADEGLIEAMKKYFSMLSKNPDMEFDYNKTREWVQTLGGYCMENIDNDFQSSIDSLSDIAFYYHKVGMFQYALELLRKTYEYASEKLGSKNKNTLTILGNVASVYSQSGNGQKAIEIQNKVLESYKAILDEDDKTIVYAMTNLASYYFNDKKYVKALDIQTQVHEKFCSLSGKNSLDAIYSMNTLAKMHLYSGNKENALQLQKEATDDIVNVLGEYHPTTFKFTSELALCYSISKKI